MNAGYNPTPSAKAWTCSQQSTTFTRVSTVEYVALPWWFSSSNGHSDWVVTMTEGDLLGWSGASAQKSSMHLWRYSVSGRPHCGISQPTRCFRSASFQLRGSRRCLLVLQMIKQGDKRKGKTTIRDPKNQTARAMQHRQVFPPLHGNRQVTSVRQILSISLTFGKWAREYR